MMQRNKDRRGPFQSILVPYEEEIRELRSLKPPMTFAKIAAHLETKHGITVHYDTVHSFYMARTKRPSAPTAPAVIEASKPRPISAQPPPKQAPSDSDKWDFLNMEGKVLNPHQQSKPKTQ